MKFLSIEETSKLMNDEENKPKRSKGTKTPIPMVDGMHLFTYIRNRALGERMGARKEGYP